MGETVQKAGSKIPTSPFTGKLFEMTTFCFWLISQCIDALSTQNVQKRSLQLSPKNLTVILNNLYINFAIISSRPVLRIRDPVPFSPLDPGLVKSGSGSGMNIPDHIFESLETIFLVKILKFFDADPGWEKLGSGINIPDPQHCKKADIK
jgi:hypothetical protein